MSIGTILVGIAIALIVGAYLARPFRTASVDPERAIEAWVAEARAGGQVSRGAEEAVNFCSKCGRSVGPGDHFCPDCGTRLQRGAK